MKTNKKQRSQFNFQDVEDRLKKAEILHTDKNSNVFLAGDGTYQEITFPSISSISNSKIDELF